MFSALLEMIMIVSTRGLHVSALSHIVVSPSKASRRRDTLSRRESTKVWSRAVVRLFAACAMPRSSDTLLAESAGHPPQ